MKLAHSILATAFSLVALSAVAAPSAHAAPAEYTCDIVNIKEYPGQSIVLWCKIPFPGTNVTSVAVPTTAPYADRFLSQAQTAMLSGKHFFTVVDIAVASNVAACPTGNCRPATQFFGVWQ